MKIEWMGYAWRADDRLIERIISEEMEDPKPRDRLHRRWMDNSRQTMMKCMQSRVDWNISKNRKRRKD